jgi:hypothetical protein
MLIVKPMGRMLSSGHLFCEANAKDAGTCIGSEPRSHIH